jgi:hypothetical protein
MCGVCKIFQHRRYYTGYFSGHSTTNESVPSLLLWHLSCITRSYADRFDKPDTEERQRGATNMTAQVWLNTNLVHLQKAVLCANCEIISEGRNGHCAGCGSQSLLYLSTVLGGTIERELSFGFTTTGHAVCDEVCVGSLSAAAW